MNTYRKMLIDAIKDNQGYGNRHGRYALSWDVSTWQANVGFDDCFNRCLREDARFKNVNRETFEEFCNWNNENHYEYAIEDMRRGILDGDDCSYTTYSPDTAKRFGLPFYRCYDEVYKPTDKYKRRTNNIHAYYPAKKDGWMLDGHFDVKFFDVDFGLEGRGGKHLVIKKFEGVDLDLYSDDLADDIENDDCGNYPNEWCRDLLVMITEWDSIFTTKNVAKDLEYRMDQYMVQLLDQYLFDQSVEEESCYGC